MWSIPVSEIIEKLQNEKARRVALQFPEGLKRRAFEVAAALRKEGFDVIISGDPCYGACDLALDSLDMADVLVHFGHAPVEERKGVIYEYVHFDIDTNVLDSALTNLTRDRIGLVTTIQHVHLLDEISSYLKTRGVECIVAGGNGRTPFPGQVLGCSFEAARATGAEEILYVGTGVFHPLGVQLATGSRVVSLDPYTAQTEVVNASHLLRKRFALIEKARSAKSVGILLSLKSGQKRSDLAKSLQSLSGNAFIVTLFEVSPEALLNLGFDCYVNTACPRLAYDDQIRFAVPLLSPPEFEILCGVRSWDDYIIDEIV
jgi:2-(3-amino-3-carboxypropyl)histidine synthase